MNFNLRIKLVFHKLKHWEYWPVWIVYLPCFLIYPYYAFRSRCALFFTAANPSIKYGGAFLSSKQEIHKKLPLEFQPITMMLNPSTTSIECHNFIAHHELSFPVLVKPDMGLRGKGIKIISSKAELDAFIIQLDKAYLLQEFIHYDNEIGVFIVRDQKGNLEITSIVNREFMSILGNGKSNVHQLILAVPRYAMQIDWLNTLSDIDFTKVLAMDEELVFTKIGNHSKGTIFRNGENLNTEELLITIETIFRTYPDFNYGRLDIKFKNHEDLLEGINFKIIELNGVFSEPAHIYDPDFKLLDGWKVLLQHFKKLYNISLRSINEGYKPLTFLSGIKKIREHFLVVSKM